MQNITEIKFSHFTLVNVAQPTSRDLDELARQWHFHPDDLLEFSGRSLRTRLETYPEYLCIVTLWPTYRRSTREILPAELSFFLRPDALVVLLRGTLHVYTEQLHRLAATPEVREQFCQPTPAQLLSSLLAHLSGALYPMIDHLIDDCDTIEREIFTNHERRMIQHILAIRRNITDVRKILQPHASVFKRLALQLGENRLYAQTTPPRAYLELTDAARGDWEILENLKERIVALQETNESQLSFRLSEIMKTLTIISVFTFPLTLVAALFSVSHTAGMPFLDRPGSFWYIVAIEALLAGTMYLVFKRKRWF